MVSAPPPLIFHNGGLWLFPSPGDDHNRRTRAREIHGRTADTLTAASKGNVGLGRSLTEPRGRR
jgi:hypothetical protein